MKTPVDDPPVERGPAVTVALVAANLLAFLWQLNVGPPGNPVELRIQLSALVGGVIPYEVVTFRDIGPRDIVPPPFTILTSMFLHGSWAHLGGNLAFLWVFGPSVERALGHGRYLLFYLASGVAAALAHTLLAMAVGDPFVPMVGASGAIAGVLAAYLVLAPRAPRRSYPSTGFFIGVWFVLQVVYAFLGGSGAGVAFFAHVGGFVLGWILAMAMARNRPGQDPSVPA